MPLDPWGTRNTLRPKRYLSDDQEAVLRRAFEEALIRLRWEDSDLAYQEMKQGDEAVCGVVLATTRSANHLLAPKIEGLFKTLEKNK